MQETMAELQRLATVDPAAQARLLADLRQSDPAIWPLVMQQFRATAAYRQRLAESSTAPSDVKRLPTVNDVALAPTAPLSEAYPITSAPPPETQPPALLAAEPIQQASYVAPPSAPYTGDSQQRLAAAIEALEAEVPQNPTTPAEVAQHARLRMLYAAAGRRDDALRPISAAPESAEQFLSKELEGLTRWLDAEQTRDVAAKAAEVKPVFAEALSRLSEAAPLLVRNVAFCTEVLSYGCTKRFDKYEFRAKQEVLLYAEVENFSSEPTAKGYHTSLQSSYKIVDSQGQAADERTFAATEEHCQNLRRDFFIGYHLRLPKEIRPGKYTLRLSIEDLKCHKVGQASIDFEIKEGRDEAETTKESERGGENKKKTAKAPLKWPDFLLRDS